MSDAPGDPSGPLAILPSYQPTAGPRRDTPEESVWRLAPTRGLEPASASAFLEHGLPSTRSLFRGVSRVAPSLTLVHRASASLRSDEADESRARALLGACSDAVGARVGAGAREVSLSGGVDSAVLCMLAARHEGSRVRAWSMDVHFADEVERHNARTVARLAGVEQVDVPIPDALLPDLFERAVIANESAILNARAVASFAFYAEAKKLGASVMLSGAGADEVLMGNPGARASALARIEEDRRLARTVLRSAVDNLGRTAHGPWSQEGGPESADATRGDRSSQQNDTESADVARRGHSYQQNDREIADAARGAPWTLEEIPKVSDESGGGLPSQEGGPEVSEEVHYAAWVLRELVLPPELRGARAHGLTVHMPYLDSRFADVALALPESSLSRDGVGKWLFRYAVRGLVPDEVRLARKTPRYGHTALSSPVRARWLELYRAWLSAARLEPLEVIDPKAVAALLERYTRMEPEAPEASGVDRLLMRLCSLAMLHAHAVHGSPCPES
ncbi:asparagine synthase-related protein [Myxococcus qinghaiensis]|uniref:asparagine synthase-related protein n=1 Tax=Myxococcus qinghaiensis TaxID=2906758 RepID=UPI0020A7B239|nr:asparagine synthase-related protein [Myxococcus qinghaiensis]MCP3163207.1 asparagine synthase C-terminal domain-containing protein [Myxococcus qinghaiensis]